MVGVSYLLEKRKGKKIEIKANAATMVWSRASCQKGGF